MSVFGSVVLGAFQITFRVKIHANDVFLFFKNYFWHQHIKTIQNIQTILNFSKKKNSIFLGTQPQPRSQTSPIRSSAEVLCKVGHSKQKIDLAQNVYKHESLPGQFIGHFWCQYLLSLLERFEWCVGVENISY